MQLCQIDWKVDGSKLYINMQRSVNCKLWLKSFKVYFLGII